MATAKTRLDFRVDSEAKKRIERAALLSGQTVSSFALSTLLSRANTLLAEHDNITLDIEASKQFIERLDQDLKPNTALKRAAEQYRGLID